MDAKVKYTQLCRSLRTYGVTFFLVKVNRTMLEGWLRLIRIFVFFSQEKMSGKNKLAPRLLGVTKDSIVRVDERTKDVRGTIFIYPFHSSAF